MWNFQINDVAFKMMTTNNRFNLVESKEDNSLRSTSEKWNVQSSSKKHSKNSPTELAEAVGRKEEKPEKELMWKP